MRNRKGNPGGRSNIPSADVGVPDDDVDIHTSMKKSSKGYTKLPSSSSSKKSLCPCGSKGKSSSSAPKSSGTVPTATPYVQGRGYYYGGGWYPYPYPYYYHNPNDAHAPEINHASNLLYQAPAMGGFGAPALPPGM